MENNKREMSAQDKAKIESLVTMSIANRCYENLENNSDFELIPVYCSMFVGNAQNGEITAVEAMKILKLSKTTFYRRVKEYRSKE